jgi:hypothetical protein
MTGLSYATISRRLEDGSLPKFQPGGENTAVRVPIDALTKLTPPRPPEDKPLPAEHAVDPQPRTPRKGPQPKWESMYETPNPN